MPLKQNKRKVISLANQLLWCYSFLSVMPYQVLADEFDTLQFRASLNKGYDNNVFRRETNESSDEITTSTLGVRIDKPYALQRFIFDLAYIDTKYQKNDFLDFAAKNYNIAWQWSLTPSLTGVLSSTKTQNQLSFRDLNVPIQNINTITENIFRAEYSPHGVFALIGGYSQITTENSRQFNIQAPSARVGIDYGARYNFSSGSYLTFLGHRRSGQVNNRPLNSGLQFDTEFVENEYEIDIFIKETGKSSLTGRLSRVDRENDNFSERDYQVYLGNINYDYQLSGKLLASLGLARFINLFETNNSTYTTTDAVNTSLKYDVSDKISTNVFLRASERSFEGSGVFSTSDRVDKEYSYGASVSWRPYKSIGFSLASTKSNRNSNLAGFDFDDTLTNFSVELRL